MARKRSRVVRASEIGQYVYCARAWWLGQVLGYRSSHQEAMEAGTAAHERHGRAVMGYHRLRQWGVLLLILALLATVALLCILVRR